MDNEKNFIIAIVITLAILLLYPTVMKKFYPDAFPDPQLKSKEIFTDFNPQKNPAVLPEKNLSADNNSPKAANISTEKEYIIENDRYMVTISSPGAEIESIIVKEFKNPETKQPEHVMDVLPQSPGVFYTPGLISSDMEPRVEVLAREIRFHYEKGSNLTIVKTLGFDNEGFGLRLGITIENKGSAEAVVDYEVIAATGISTTSSLETRFTQAVSLLADNKLKKKNLTGIKKRIVLEGDVQVSGIKARYFTLALVPFTPVSNVVMDRPGAGDELASVLVGIKPEPLKIKPGQTAAQKFLLYAGPNKHEEMAVFQSNIEYVKGRGVFAGMSELLVMLLRVLFNICKNYGLAVILLSITINLILSPLTIKSLSSMKEMQSLQPLVEELRTQHKDNPQKLNKEIMELYKKHKVNPAGGCLPMILQMPVFFALYGVLMRTIELRGATFLWINDLSSPDALFTLSKAFPFIGNKFNILPLIMVVLTFVQQKTTNPQKGNEQQQAMAMFMPVFLGVIFYNFPSGLVLYFLTNSIFSFVIQLRLRGAKKAV